MNQEQRPPRVFVTQEIPVNYADAERYGEIVFLTSQNFQQVTGSRVNEHLFRMIVQRLADYRPGVDFIVPAGGPLNIGLAFLVAAWKGGKMRVLQWDNRDHVYRQYDVDLDAITKAAAGNPRA